MSFGPTFESFDVNGRLFFQGNLNADTTFSSIRQSLGLSEDEELFVLKSDVTNKTKGGTTGNFSRQTSKMTRAAVFGKVFDDDVVVAPANNVSGIVRFMISSVMEKLDTVEKEVKGKVEVDGVASGEDEKPAIEVQTLSRKRQRGNKTADDEINEPLQLALAEIAHLKSVAVKLSQRGKEVEKKANLFKSYYEEIAVELQLVQAETDELKTTIAELEKTIEEQDLEITQHAAATQKQKESEQANCETRKDEIKKLKTKLASLTHSHFVRGLLCEVLRTARESACKREEERQTQIKDLKTELAAATSRSDSAKKTLESELAQFKQREAVALAETTTLKNELEATKKIVGYANAIAKGEIVMAATLIDVEEKCRKLREMNERLSETLNGGKK